MLTTKKNLLARAVMTLFLAVLGSAGAWAADVVKVGDGSTANSNLPSNQNSKYFVSQQIYTKDEIGKSGMITSIAFYNWDRGYTRSYDIYLTHTAKDKFDNNTDWVKVNANDMVFSGQVALIDWTTIELEKPFVYDGTQNLLLTVVDNTGRSDGNNNLCGAYDTYHQALYCKASDSVDPTQSIEKTGTFAEKKNIIKLCFDANPKPSGLKAVDIGDVSAQIQCNLRGDATAWNLRYRKVGTSSWITLNDLTTRSKLIEGLTPVTEYEAQVQAVFAGNKTSDWTDLLTFTTNCCPLEQQSELMYKLRSTNGWYNYAVQIVDVDAGDIEVALLRSPNSGLYEGTITLCCGHNYKVNWVFDETHSWNSSQLGFDLYFQPGDLFYSMAYGEAPEKNEQLTTFVLDCTDYCAPMPKNIEIDDIFHDGATISFTSATAGVNIAYSTEADFNPATAINTLSVTFDAADGGSGGNGVSYRLSGLESQTDYYVAIQSVCTAQPLDDGGKSRWSKPVKITTGAEEAPVENITTIGSGSAKTKVNWTSKGKETKHNVYIRQQTSAGKPVSRSQVLTFNLDDEDGRAFEETGESSWGSFVYGSMGTALQQINNWFVLTDLAEGDEVKAKLTEGKTASDPNEKVLVSEIFSVGAEPLTKGLDAEAKKAEVKTKIIKLKRGKKLSKSEWKAAYKEYKKAKAAYEETEEGSADEKEAYETYKTLKRSLGLDKTKLKKAARKSVRVGYKAYRKAKPWRKTRTRAAEENSGEYFVWINHEEGCGFLDISELEIVSSANWSEWEVVEGVTGDSYTFDGLTPGTTYEVIIEPVYDDGTTGPEESGLFTTFSELVDPLPSEFSIGGDEKVRFAKGNLRHTGDMYEGSWSIAPHQYDILGQDNVEKQRDDIYTADLVDLLCWSSATNYYGVTFLSYNDEDDIIAKFQGAFADWGENPEVIDAIGTGWRTLSKDEWNYIINGRPNAATLRSFATVAGVKGLIIVADNWTESLNVNPQLPPLNSETYTAEEWALMEEAGAVFLPTAGQMTQIYDRANYQTITTVSNDGLEGYYWTSTPSDDSSDMNAYALKITGNSVTNTDVSRRIASAVRLVRKAGADEDPSGIKTVKQRVVADGQWYDLQGRRLNAAPVRKGVYLRNGRTVVVK